MANKRINDLPSETDPASTDVFAIDGATTRKATRANVLKENLEAIRALTSEADKGIQFTGAGTAAVYDLTAAGKALLDDADAGTQRTTLGLGNVDNTSDADKPVSTATQTALDLKADTADLGDLALKDTASESDLSLTDVTTANVSTTKHGFAPKLPNDATKYLDGTGAYTVPAGGSGSDTLFATVADVEAATIPSSVDAIQTAGYTTEGDGGGSIDTNAIYARVGSEPSHEGKIQSADGAWWELTGRRVSVMQFGAVPSSSDLDTDPDAASAISDCIAYANLTNAGVTIPGGLWPLDSALTSPTFFIEINGSQGGGLATTLYKRYVEADTNKGIISLGAYGASIADIAFAAGDSASGGSAISAILPNNAPNIGILRLKNIYVSGGDGFNSDLYINGQANTGGVGGTGGKSYRSVFLENCHFFGAAQYAVMLLSASHVFANNIFMAADGGTLSSGVLFYVSGASDAGNDDIYWHGIISGALHLEYTTRSNFACIVTGNITNTANVINVTVTDCLGVVATSWVTSRVLANPGAWVTSTPTPTASSGTFTSVSSTVAYRVQGKTVFCRGKILITTVGTASGSIKLQLPFSPKSEVTFAGKDIAVNGFVYGADVNTSGLMTILKYDNTSNIVAGLNLPFNFVTELA